MRTIGLVVPHLDGGGGVPAVARFLLQVIQSSARYRTRVISLVQSSRHPLNSSILRPWSLAAGPRSEVSVWEGNSFTTVGAACGELEFMRYRPRRELARQLEGCDLIQVVAGTPAWARSVLELGRPVSLHVATLARLERRRRARTEGGLIGVWRKLMTQITDSYDEQAVRAVQALQGQNPWLVQYVREANARRPEVDIRYAPPGIDTNFFSPLPDTHSTDRAYLFCVGRLEDPRKNVDLLLRTFLELSSKHPGLELWTAGSAPPPDSYFARAKYAGVAHRVRHVARPSQEELLKLYRGATAFVSSSDEEGFGVAIVEAMACGVPVVSTRSGGPEGYLVDGENGYLVALDDAHQMADALQRLIADPALAHRIGQAGRQTAVSTLSYEAAGSLFLDVWDRLLAQPKS